MLPAGVSRAVQQGAYATLYDDDVTGHTAPKYIAHLLSPTVYQQ